MIGRTVCYMHGGKTPAGMASPHTKHGRYSKYLPARLLERYQEARTDEELLALREEIALLDARLTDLLKRVDTGESGAIWRELKSTYQEFATSRDHGDVPRMTECLGAMERLINRGISDYAAWHEVGLVLEQRRRLVESERKRLVELQQVITTEHAMTLLAVVVDVIRRHVQDTGVLANISADISRLVASGNASPGQNRPK